MYMQVLLPKDVIEMVTGNPRIGLPHSRMAESLLHLTLLRETCITPVPTDWYRERQEIETEFLTARGFVYCVNHEMMIHINFLLFWCRYMKSRLAGVMNDTRFADLEVHIRWKIRFLFYQIL